MAGKGNVPVILTLNSVVLVLVLGYDCFFFYSLVAKLQGIFTTNDLSLITLFFFFNLMNTVAIIYFFLGVRSEEEGSKLENKGEESKEGEESSKSESKSKKVEETINSGHFRVYIFLNTFAILMEFLTLIYIFAFGKLAILNFL